MAGVGEPAIDPGLELIRDHARMSERDDAHQAVMMRAGEERG
jgi:hypothetical protein